MPMKPTDKTLMEQMCITELDIERRKALLSFTEADTGWLVKCRPVIEMQVDTLIDEFYQIQTGISEIALLIDNADILKHLREVQRSYILDLFGGLYGLDYINNRLRIGLVHKRMGIAPKFYLSATHSLKTLLSRPINEAFPEDKARQAILSALDKLLLFDITLVFETYIHSLISEVETEREKSDNYARTLEVKVRERTQQLEELARRDPLTGLLNTRFLSEMLDYTIKCAQRRFEPVSFVYFDIDDFKKINDIEGHQRGDEVLCMIGDVIKHISRAEDSCFRYGGDEFCIILPNCREEQARDIYVHRFNEVLVEYRQDISLSIGIYQTGPDRYDEPDAVIRFADRRMYEAKRASKAARQSSDA
jgi:diguanylate cyclase